MTNICDYTYNGSGALYVCFQDATGTVTGEGGVCAVDGPYPAMVSWEMDSGSLLPQDARELGLALIRLSESAEVLNMQVYERRGR